MGGGNEFFKALYDGQPDRATKLLQKWAATGSKRNLQLHEMDSYGNRIHHVAAALGAVEFLKECATHAIPKPKGANLQSKTWEVFMAGEWQVLPKKESSAVDAAEGGTVVEGYIYNKDARWRQDSNGRRFPLRHHEQCENVVRVLNLDVDLQHCVHNGFVLGGENGMLTVSVFEGSYAWTAGLCVGDEVKLQENGTMTVGAPSTSTPLFPIDAANGFGQTALALAIRASKTEAVHALLEMKADGNLPVPIRMLGSEKTGTGTTDAQGTGEFEFGPGLVTTGTEFDVNISKPGTTGLVFHELKHPYRVYTSFAQAAQSCVTRGDELLSVSGKATENMDYMELVKILHCRPCWMRFRKGRGLWRTPLHLACSFGNVDIIRLLLKFNARVNEVDECDMSPLDVAVQKQHMDAVAVLRDAGASYTPSFTLPDDSRAFFDWPSYWHHAVLSPYSYTIADCGRMTRAIGSVPAMIPFFQTMFNQAYVTCTTRDRRDGGGLPKWYRVKKVELNANGTNYREYQQRKATMMIRRKGENLSVPGGLKNDMDWSSALRDISPNGQFEYPICAQQGEVYLFHGTKADAAHKICSSDFMLSLTGTGAGTLYGRGLYMAESPTKSDEYTTENNGWRAMILCRVLLGKHYYCDEHFPDTDELTVKVLSGQHDSILGDREKIRNTFREFIVFDDDQVYPEWIIWYERRYDEIPARNQPIPQSSCAPIHPCAPIPGVLHKEGIPMTETEDGGEEEACPSQQQRWREEGESPGYPFSGTASSSRDVVNMASADGGPVTVFFHDGRMLSLSLNFIETTFDALFGQCNTTWALDDGPYAFYVRKGSQCSRVIDRSRTLKDFSMEPHGHILLLVDSGDTKKFGECDIPNVASDSGVGAEQINRMNKLKRFYESRDINGDGRLSRGELRSILAPLRLDNEQFDKVFSRFDATNSGWFDLCDCEFLIGRQALQSDADVTCEQLLIEASEHMLGLLKSSGEHGMGDMQRAFRGEEMAETGERGDLVHEHFRNLDSDDTGIGKKDACHENMGVNTVSVILEIIFCAGVILGLFFTVGSGAKRSLFQIAPFVIAGLCYVIYLYINCHKTKALENMVEGLTTVVERVTGCRRDNLHYSWSIQCYHYETRHRTVRDSDGNTRRETYQERVNTHRASRRGELRTVDNSGDFIPNTDGKFCYIKFDLERDFSQSNYYDAFRQFVAENDRDTHNDTNETSYLPNSDNIYVSWLPGKRSWWMDSSVNMLFLLFGCGPCFRVKLDSVCCHQKFTYRKQVFEILH